MFRKSLIFSLFLFSTSAYAAYTQLQWGVDQGVSPYSFGANIGATWRQLGTVSSTGEWALAPSTTSSIVTARKTVLSAQQGTTVSGTIYGSHAPPGWLTQDVTTSTLTLSPSTNITHGAASADYVRNIQPWKDDPACPGYVAGIGCNAGVGYFSAVEAGVDGAKTWALNPTLVDNTSNTQVTTDTIGRTLVGTEFDLSVYANKTTVQGLAFILQGPGVPLGATAIQVSAATSVGNNAFWTYAFTTGNGTATNAMSIGATATTGANTPSQPIYLNGFDSGNAAYAFKLQSINHALNFTDNTLNDGVTLVASTGNPGIMATGASTNANLNLTAKGATGNVVFGSAAKISNGLYLTNVMISQTAPTIGSGFGTSPSIVASNGTAAFQVNVGTGGTASSGTITMPTAANGWSCSANDVTTVSTSVFLTRQTASTATSVTITNYNTAGAATAWVASDKINMQCMAF